MSLSDINKVKKHISVIKGIYNNCCVLFNDYELLSRNTNAGGVPEEILFFERVKYSQYNVTILELAKLVGESIHQEFTVQKLFELIDNSQNLKINIDQFRARLSGDLANPVKGIKDLRDKVFAHTSNKAVRGKLDIDLTLEDIQSVLDFIKEILTFFYPKLFLISFQPEVTNEGASEAYTLVRNGV